jgi:hypothetical protein
VRPGEAPHLLKPSPGGDGVVFALCTLDHSADRCSWTEPQYNQLKAQIAAYKYVCRGLPVPSNVAQALAPPTPEAWMAQRHAIQQATHNLYKYKYEAGEMVYSQQLSRSNMASSATISASG